ncbi:GATA zinc finger domain-containing protein 14-like [Planococcus citri]|uniref:GATA zinc finger domain-containing protein 14-like n=1 Tax=Planococcus citri TaxID=170843 RepID=UPI0031F8C9EA
MMPTQWQQTPSFEWNRMPNNSWNNGNGLPQSTFWILTANGQWVQVPGNPNNNWNSNQWGNQTPMNSNQNMGPKISWNQNPNSNWNMGSNQNFQNTNPNGGWNSQKNAKNTNSDRNRNSTQSPHPIGNWTNQPMITSTPHNAPEPPKKSYPANINKNVGEGQLQIAYQLLQKALGNDLKDNSNIKFFPHTNRNNVSNGVKQNTNSNNNGSNNSGGNNNNNNVRPQNNNGEKPQEARKPNTFRPKISSQIPLPVHYFVIKDDGTVEEGDQDNADFFAEIDNLQDQDSDEGQDQGNDDNSENQKD